MQIQLSVSVVIEKLSVQMGSPHSEAKSKVRFADREPLDVACMRIHLIPPSDLPSELNQSITLSKYF